MKKTNQKRSANPKKRRLATHVRASLLSVAPHKATGHRLPHRHTSHGALLVILLLAGIILFIGITTIQANADSSSDVVHITARVNGAPPNQGAVITTPPDKTVTNANQLQVGGTCPSGTVVAIYDQGTSVGSTVCQNSTFLLSVQINTGVNVLQAQDYDSLDQAGPVTGQIQVQYIPTTAVVVLPTQTVNPAITAPPAAQPAANPCYQDGSSQTPQPNQLSLTVSCITRNIFVGETIQLPVSIWGGVGPYAVTIDWGDSTPTELRSFPNPGNYTVDHVYQDADIKQLALKVADSTGVTYQAQTVIDVNGTTPSVATGTAATSEPMVSDPFAWINTTVPVYVGLVILILGFWVGDIFQRYINVKKRPAHRRGHA